MSFARPEVIANLAAGGVLPPGDLKMGDLIINVASLQHVVTLVECARPGAEWRLHRTRDGVSAYVCFYDPLGRVAYGSGRGRHKDVSHALLLAYLRAREQQEAHDGR